MRSIFLYLLGFCFERFVIECVEFLNCSQNMSLGMPNEPGIVTKSAPKERKKHDRFNGMSEEEVSKRTLPDHLANNLDIIIVSVIFAFIHISD